MTASRQGYATQRLAADEAGIARAALLLREGACVAFPTETVYGLGADATSPQAVAGIYAAKERPRFNPLIAHCPDVDTAMREGVFDTQATALAKAFWPGPLTLVVPRAAGGSACDLARAGLDSVALRVPAHPLAQKLLAAVGRPVAAPSANRSGRVSPTQAAHVAGDLDGRIAAILDGGPTQVGLESTIIACLDGTPRLLRPGGVPREAIEAALGRPLAGAAPGSDPHAPVAPGMLISHYAPRARMRLEARDIRPGEAALLFGGGTPQGVEHAAARLDLSPSGDLAEAAAQLFGYLRALDETGAAGIAVAPVPEFGLGEAINDRLRRAAADR
ncbi:MAG: threonylcarbamoyl-AMP synthase [Salinarimonadaceae bacterium]|nr:MAG: threonylcarbamoyl-AMP synthase [Salinarimonadaceae bacterium]